MDSSTSRRASCFHWCLQDCEVFGIGVTSDSELRVGYTQRARDRSLERAQNHDYFGQMIVENYRSLGAGVGVECDRIVLSILRLGQSTG